MNMGSVSKEHPKISIIESLRHQEYQKWKHVVCRWVQLSNRGQLVIFIFHLRKMLVFRGVFPILEMKSIHGLPSGLFSLTTGWGWKVKSKLGYNTIWRSPTLNGILCETSVSRQVSSQFKETISAVWGWTNLRQNSRFRRFWRNRAQM